MNVKISDYGCKNNRKFIEYLVSGLNSNHLDYLKNNLDEDISVEGDILTLTMYFDESIHPFQSEVAKIRLDDFIACEEIEMNLFLSSFLEDMNYSSSKR